MLDQDIFRIDDPGRIRDLIRAHPWATLVSHTERDGPVVSHLPILLEDDAPASGARPAQGGPHPAGSGLTLFGHLARADAELHELGDHEVVVVVQGPHGYISPTWYDETPHVPTWNFVVVHVSGRPQILDVERTYSVLSATVDLFEDRMVDPWRLENVDSYARRIAGAVTAFRLPLTRVTAKAKLSQNESEEVSRRVVAALESDQPFAQHALARAMRDTWRQR